jgi:hypothetical protein
MRLAQRSALAGVLALAMVPFPAFAEPIEQSAGPAVSTVASAGVGKGFVKLQSVPLPGQIVSLELQDEEQRAALPPPCTGRRSKGKVAGSIFGGFFGMFAGFGIAKALGADNHEAEAAAAGGLGAGSTIGYMLGKASDGGSPTCPDIIAHERQKAAADDALLEKTLAVGLPSIHPGSPYEAERRR